MDNVKILDCTLRDGGYINNWEFGMENSSNLLKNLQKANIDYIELGFLSANLRKNSQTIFNSFKQADEIISFQQNPNIKFGAMISYGEFDISNIPNARDSKLDFLRINFKKKNLKLGIEFCQKVIDKGFEVFINPCFINQYNESELEQLCEFANSIHPFAFSIVDSMGCYTNDQMSSLYNLISSKLNSNITICFHSHNNLQLSYSNSLHLINLSKERNLIIDSTLYGMGRGAGNLNTEIIAQCFNQKYETSYILKSIDEYILPIYQKTPWGAHIAYFLSAIHQCHPNYAKYLIDLGISSCEIDRILSCINIDDKFIYNKDVIKDILILNCK